MLLLVSAGCAKESGSAVQFTDLLDAVNEKENRGNNLGMELNEKEQLEQELFNETMALTQKKYEAVKDKVAALKKSAHGRFELLEKEESAATESKRELERLAEWADTDDATGSAKKAVEAMHKRSALHEEFILQYKKLLNSQTELYTQLEDQSIREREIQQQVERVNERIAVCLRLLGEFNEMTKEANRLTGRALKSLEAQK